MLRWGRDYRAADSPEVNTPAKIARIIQQKKMPYRRTYSYDVCLSFAGEDRRYVKAVAKQLKGKGLRVFFDEDEVVQLWGKNLFEHFHHVYSKASRFCIVFVSKAYVQKSWTNHERRSAQERALSANAEYILPARFDKTAIPGMYATMGYVELQSYTPKQFAELIVTKIRPDLLLELQEARHYFPPEPDIFLARFDTMTEEPKEALREVARSFFDALIKMSVRERAVIGAFFYCSCAGELPDFLHANSDLVRRIAKRPAQEVLECLKGLTSLGIKCRTRKVAGQSHPDVVLQWTAVLPDAERWLGIGTNYTSIANELMGVVRSHYCEEHYMRMIRRANFSAAATVTAIPDIHG